MRADMSKVIVERPRLGAGWSQQGDRLPRNIEDWPTRARKCPDKTKHLNENLAPLKRYLRSQVGSRWDDVYSAISKHLRPSNAVQQHVRDHLRDFVSTRVEFREGVPYSLPGVGWYHGIVRYFYVCPNTARLCEHITSGRGWLATTVQKRGCRCGDCRRKVRPESPREARQV